MTWLQRYRCRYFFGNSIWILPVVSMVAAMIAVRLLHFVEELMGWESKIHPDTARAVLGTMAASMFTFLVFISSALLVAVQLASAQLTPRIIALVFRDPVIKCSLIVFTFTFTFSLAALVRIQDFVPLITAYVAAYGCLFSLGMFFYLLDHIGKSLRPSGAVRTIAILGREVIEEVYPRLLSDVKKSATELQGELDQKTARIIPSPSNGVVLAFDVRGLVSLAQRHKCVIEVMPQVGDFVATGDPLFQIYHDGADVSTNALSGLIALGQERTIEQDPAYAFRMLVDIASKGLSPAINDPTTAVLVIDQIHHLLRDLGHRCLDDERVRDAEGHVRLVYRTPDWEDYVVLAVTEIRHFGGTSIQVARRLRSMLENLIHTLPEECRGLLQQELTLLQRSTERFFQEPEDRALADVGDSQGVGGKHVQGNAS